MLRRRVATAAPDPPRSPCCPMRRPAKPRTAAGFCFGASQLRDFFQVRPGLPLLPAFLELALGLFQCLNPARAPHRTMLGERPKPTQMLRTAPSFVDAADIPAAGIDGVNLADLVDPGAEAGAAELE